LGDEVAERSGGGIPLRYQCRFQRPGDAKSRVGPVDGQLVLGRRLNQVEVLRLKPRAFEQAALVTFGDLALLYKLG